MTDRYWVRPRRLPVVRTPPRCRICQGEGFLELTPLPDGRLVCPCCRYTHDQRVAHAIVVEAWRRQLAADPDFAPPA